MFWLEFVLGFFSGAATIVALAALAGWFITRDDSNEDGIYYGD